jgi:hypothetical protein
MLATARMTSANRPDLVPPFIPARLPAAEMSWHGNPPVMTSTGSTAVQSMAVMSPRLGTSGQCLARTLDAAGSISECHTTCPPMAA